jgi:hypothetical protein
VEADQQEDEEQMEKLDRSIRKLAVKRRSTVNDNVGSSPFPQAAYNSPPPPLWRQEAFQLPQVDQQGYNLTNETVANLLSVLAKGQSKLATPGWPKFTDSYRSYYTFKEPGGIPA